MPRGGRREGAGRPKIDPSERKRSAPTTRLVRLDNGTAAAIAQYAQVHGVSQTEAARVLIARALGN
jgi:ABC-type molybdenum transport system ATPase subunit/photorepair protein PhrA